MCFSVSELRTDGGYALPGACTPMNGVWCKVKQGINGPQVLKTTEFGRLTHRLGDGEYPWQKKPGTCQ